MTTTLKCLLTVVLSGATAMAGAVELGTADECIALVKKAIVFAKANGRDKIIAEINSKSPNFRVKDLYLFMSTSTDGAVLAHGANTKLVGRELGDLRDVDGVFFARKFRDVINSKEGKGWVDYKWPNSASGQIEPKSTYLERADDVYYACGIKPVAK
ncbi:cache domain-containing protein [Oxalobacteraceae bacterium]|nr:cache domain-containing protein [Oxalobacteraceae bacterium]